MQPDPTGYPDGADRYQMERGNPIRNLDPSGLWTWTDVWRSLVTKAPILSPLDSIVENIRAISPTAGETAEKFLPYGTVPQMVEGIAAQAHALAEKPSALAKQSNLMRAQYSVCLGTWSLDSLPWQRYWGEKVPFVRDPLAPTDPHDRAAFDFWKMAAQAAVLKFGGVADASLARTGLTDLGGELYGASRLVKLQDYLGRRDITLVLDADGYLVPRKLRGAFQCPRKNAPVAFQSYILRRLARTGTLSRF